MVRTPPVTAALCVMVKGWPAICRVPILTEPVFAATLKLTEPFPLPVAPEPIVTHGALLTAVQLQPDPAVTFTEPVPTAAENDWLAGERVYVQAGGWVM